MNMATIITLAIVSILLVFAIVYKLKGMKKGNFCSGNCSGCAVRCETLKNYPKRK